MDYKKILKEDEDIVIIDYSLVNVMGTLLSFSGEFNEELYDAMLKAESEGEKILIYSINPPFYLHRLVDLEKFPCIGKEIFLSPVSHMCLGKIIDDKLVKGAKFFLSKDENLIHPADTEKYNFSRDELPAGLKNPLFKI